MTTQLWDRLYAFQAAFPQQAAFCSDPGRIVVANAAIRTGKTYAAAPKALNRIRRAKPGPLQTYWFIAPTFEEGIAQKIECARLIPEHQIDVARQGKDDRWRNLKSGGGKVWLRGNKLIEFKSAERPEGLVARKVHGVWWTEIARSKYQAWANVRGRLSNTMGWLIADTSPFGHSWFYNDILKPAYDGVLPDTTVHRWTAIDSPFIPRAEVEAARLSLPKAFFERDYMASDDVFMGQILDIDQALHIVPVCPFVPEFAVVSIDVNTTSTHPAEFVWALATPERAWMEGAYKRVIGLDYRIYAQDIARHVAELKLRFPRVQVIVDPSMHTELKGMLNAAGVFVGNADNEVLAGIRTLGSALMPGPSGAPRLTFSPACGWVVDQLKAQRWVVDGDGVVKARPDKTLDDGAFDATRYLAMALFRASGSGRQLR